MTTKKKIFVAIAAVASAVVLVVVSVLATVAYLTSSAAVSNVFTIGDSRIIMDESKVTPDGKVAGEERVDTNSYHLVPNSTYTKDPIITMKAGSESSYLFIIVRNDIEAIEDPAKLTIKSQLEKNGWGQATVATAATGIVYVYKGVDAEGNLNTNGKGVEAKDGDVQIPLFESFSIKPDADCKAYGAAKITITAVAIQTNGFGEEEGSLEALLAAWQAVIQTYPYIHTGNTEQGGGAQA
ncbi:MAG: hypothetical protein IJB34_03560 [Clostridia bacterium]|nr:hypothetical protein [Clostridia bacterium]